MKRLKPYLMLGLFIVSLSGFVGCGGDDAPSISPEEKQLSLLSRAWQLSSVTLDDDPTNAFDGLTVTLTENKTFSVTDNYEPVWPSSGTFDFGADLFTIERNDGVTISITNTLSESSMTLSFNYDISPEGRTNGILGHYVFQFTAN